MKLFVFCSFLFCSIFRSINTGKVESEIVVKAINGVLVKYFAVSSPKVDLLYFGERKSAGDAICEKLLRTRLNDVSISYSTRNSLDNIASIQLNTSSILIFDSIVHFHAHMKNILWMIKNGVWHKHLVYAPGLTGDDILQDHKTSMAINSVNFLINFNETSIELATAFMYTKEKCGENQIESINRFLVNKLEWEDDEFYFDKFYNFFGCELHVYLRSEGFTPLGKKIYDELSRQLNFEIVETVVERETFYNEIYDKLSEIIRHPNQLWGNMTTFHVSNVLYTDDMTIAVPAGLPLTDLEKMFAMFDTATWVAIGFSFAVALLTIQVVNRMPRKFQKFVFGRDIRAPTLNTVSVFLTGGQSRLPGRNFARYLLMLFMIWSLIFRTCYQSKMFENMQNDMRHPSVRTFADFNRMNFTLLLRKHEFGWMQFLDGRRVSILYI